MEDGCKVYFSEPEGLGYFKKNSALERVLLRFYTNWKPLLNAFFFLKKKNHLTCCSQLLFYSDTQEIESCEGCCKILSHGLCDVLKFSSLPIFSFSSLLCWGLFVFPQWPSTDSSNLNILSENWIFKKLAKRCWDHPVMLWHTQGVHLKRGVGWPLLSSSATPSLYSRHSVAVEKHRFQVLLSQCVALAPLEGLWLSGFINTRISWTLISS